MSDTITVPAPGDTLPDIPLIDSAGRTSRLTEHSRGSAVIFFMRSSTCAVCLAHVRELQRMSAAGELRDARAIVITPGGVDEATALARRTSLEVFGSGDHHRDIGLGRFLTLQHSGTFVLDEAGRVLARRTNALPNASFSKREIIEALG